MADKSPDEMNYEALAQEALRGVIKAALRRAAAPGGIPGAHHFYITFRTHGPGVAVPPDLASRYPEEMTIVLQHQFWDLAPGETFFSVVLKFGGAPKKLSDPCAIWLVWGGQRYRVVALLSSTTFTVRQPSIPGGSEVKSVPACSASAPSVSAPQRRRVTVAARTMNMTHPMSLLGALGLVPAVTQPRLKEVNGELNAAN